MVAFFPQQRQVELLGFTKSQKKGMNKELMCTYLTCMPGRESTRNCSWIFLCSRSICCIRISWWLSWSRLLLFSNCDVAFYHCLLSSLSLFSVLPSAVSRSVHGGVVICARHHENLLAGGSPTFLFSARCAAVSDDSFCYLGQYQLAKRTLVYLFTFNEQLWSKWDQKILF